MSSTKNSDQQPTAIERLLEFIGKNPEIAEAIETTRRRALYQTQDDIDPHSLFLAGLTEELTDILREVVVNLNEVEA